MFGRIKESEQHLNINWKHFYLSVLALVIPMALQNLINVGVTAADVVMLGKVGEHALSGASLAGQVQYIMTLFLFGLTSGATVLTAQYWGKKDICTIEKILGLGNAFSRNCDSCIFCGGPVYSSYIDEDFYFRSRGDRTRSGLSSDCQLVLYFYGDYADLSLYYEKCRAGCCGDSCILMLSDL